jgi:hypothetical protein
MLCFGGAILLSTGQLSQFMEQPTFAAVRHKRALSALDLVVWRVTGWL